jgi:hypothetical protein
MICAIATILAVLPATAEIIDRIAVSFGNQVITRSEIDRQIRVMAFLDRTKPDLSAAGRHTAAERMVKQKLIRRELESTRYPAPGMDEVRPILEKFKKDNFPEEAAYTKSLAAYGITESDVLEELLRVRTMLMFMDVRFRPGVQVSEQEVRDYFTKVVEPAARAAHPGEQISIDDYWDGIETKLTGQRVDGATDAWLKEALQRTEIVYHEEAFQ